MSNLDAAEAWQRRGFRVFPIHFGTQKPAIEGYLWEASNDLEVIRRWWVKWPDANVGVATGDKFHVLDIDVKNSQPGLASFGGLGLVFDTLAVRTPSGGYHCYYSTPDDFASTIGFLPGLDFKSTGGMVLGPGSYVNGGVYTVEYDFPVAPLPDALRAHLRPPVDTSAASAAPPLVEVNHKRNVQDALHYLAQAEPAIQGMNGDDQTYKVAAALTHDYALSDATAFKLMWEHWNPRCVPPWDADDLQSKVRHGEAHGKGAIGAKTSLHLFGDIVVIPQNLAPQLPAIPVTDRFPQLGNFGNATWPDQWKPKRWVIKNFIHQGTVQSLIAPGGAGKSTLALLLAVHIVLGKPFAPGWEVKQRGKVMVVNLEEDRDSMSRKLFFICHENGYDYETVIKGINLVTAQDFPFKLTLDSKGTLNEEHAKLLIEKASAPDIVALILDPFVYIHDVPEQDNTGMAGVIQKLAFIAVAADVAVLIVHHAGKPGLSRQLTPGADDMARGASAITAGNRHNLTLVPLPKDEADEHGLSDLERKRYVRLDVSKTNLAPPGLPPLYFKLHEIGQMDGDTVGVFKLHTWEVKRCDDTTTLGRLIYDAMLENKAGAVTLQELVERWKAEDPIRDKLDKSELVKRINELYRARDYLSHQDDENRDWQFYKSREGKNVVFTTRR